MLHRLHAHFDVTRRSRPSEIVLAPRSGSGGLLTPPLAPRRGETIQQGASPLATGATDRQKKKLPERLSEIRGKRSQRQFARELGVFQQNVHRYESGTTPHADFLITLALKENISLDWLLLGRGRMRRSR